jgi:hypothetical protein
LIRHSVRASLDIMRPEPWAYCDRCNFRYLHRDLAWALDWRGTRLANLHILVCPTCLDIPQPNGRKPVVVGPDPVAVRDPRPGFSTVQMGVMPDPPWSPINEIPGDD